jgi:hypothetical protein
MRRHQGRRTLVSESLTPHPSTTARCKRMATAVIAGGNEHRSIVVLDVASTPSARPSAERLALTTPKSRPGRGHRTMTPTKRNTRAAEERALARTPPQPAHHHRSGQAAGNPTPP